LASGSTLLVDLGASGNSDVLAVTGEANVGGVVGVARSTGFQATAATYRILTATGGVTNQFNNVSNVSAILASNLIYSANAVDLQITVQSYQTAVDSTNAVHTSYAALMDRNRGNSAVQGLFDTLDFVDAATIQATFDSWAPTTESAVQNMARSSVSDAGRFYSNRISNAGRSANGGTVAVIGQPLQLASNAANGMAMPGSSAIMSDAATSAAATTMTEGSVNEDMAVYLAGGFIEGNGQSMPVANPNAPQDDFDGFFISGGLDYYLGEDSMVGFSAYYSDIDSEVALGNRSSGRTIMGSIYGTSNFMGLVMDARISAGTYNAQTLRNVTLGAQAFTLTTDDDSFFFSSEIGSLRVL
jgi:hypothetical protein